MTMPRFSRRDFVLAGFGLVLTGCAGGESVSRWNVNTPPPWELDRGQVASPNRSTSLWTPHSTPVPTSHTTATASHRSPPTYATKPYLVNQPNLNSQPNHRMPNIDRVAPSAAMVIPRSYWVKRKPILKKLNPMGAISRITVHHEGWTPVWFTDSQATIKRLQHIQRFHMQERHWGDIGYHYIVDRHGRIWEGRQIQFQGAHVKNNNKENIGVLILGNFDQQAPSQIQLLSMRAAVSRLMVMHRVPVSKVFTHQELRPTHCPGKSLQPRVAAMRRSGQFG